MNSDLKYCPRCGAPLAEGLAFGRMRRLCRYCGFVMFRDPKVAVAALVSEEASSPGHRPQDKPTPGPRILLVRRLMPPRAGYWALPAGYMDHDELPEEALVREVAEETGLHVRCTGLAGIAALGGWEERRGILLTYHCQSVEGTVTPGDDASEVRWFTAMEVPWGEIAFDSTADFLREWLAGLALSGSEAT